jgi:hypothetical protein
MKKTIGLISVVAIAMALTLAIAFSGVALASQPVPPTKETETIDITTEIVCSGTVVESQELSLEIDSGNLLNNPPLNPDARYKKCTGEIYGKIKYGEKMIGSSGVTDFDKCLSVDTGSAPNLDVHKQIGYTQGGLGSLSHEEQLRMNVIATNWICTDKKSESVLPPEEEEWKKKLCPFKKVTKTTKKVPASCEEVNIFSKIVMTDVQATTITEVGITEAPVNLKYKINAEGTGLVVAGMNAYVEDGRGTDLLSSRMAYKEKSIGYGETVEFTKDIGYKSVVDP